MISSLLNFCGGLYLIHLLAKIKHISPSEKEVRNSSSIIHNTFKTWQTKSAWVHMCAKLDIYLCTLLNWDQIERERRKQFSFLKQPKSNAFSAVKTTLNLNDRLKKSSENEIGHVVLESRIQLRFTTLEKKSNTFRRKNKTKFLRDEWQDSWVANRDISSAWIIYVFCVKAIFHFSSINSLWSALLHIYISQLKVV